MIMGNPYTEDVHSDTQPQYYAWEEGHTAAKAEQAAIVDELVEACEYILGERKSCDVVYTFWNQLQHLIAKAKGE